MYVTKSIILPPLLGVSQEVFIALTSNPHSTEGSNLHLVINKAWKLISALSVWALTDWLLFDNQQQVKVYEVEMFSQKTLLPK